MRTIQERFKEHCIADSLIGNAIREYGVENFSVNTIEEIDNIDMLAEREIYWIETLKPLYNVSKGGQLGRADCVLVKHKNNLSKYILVRCDEYKNNRSNYIHVTENKIVVTNNYTSKNVLIDKTEYQNNKGLYTVIGLGTVVVFDIYENKFVRIHKDIYNMDTARYIHYRTGKVSVIDTNGSSVTITIDEYHNKDLYTTHLSNKVYVTNNDGKFISCNEYNNNKDLYIKQCHQIK